MTATVERNQTDEGVLYATGTELGGFFVRTPDSCSTTTRSVRDRRVGCEVPVGRHDWGQVRRPVAGPDGQPLIDDEPCGNTELPLLMLAMSSVGSSVGHDHGSPVSDRYCAPFAFSGKLERVDIDADPEGNHHEPADVVEAELRAESSRQ
jgi:arylsulfatase